MAEYGVQPRQIIQWLEEASQPKSDIAKWLLHRRECDPKQDEYYTSSHYHDIAIQCYSSLNEMGASIFTRLAPSVRAAARASATTLIGSSSRIVITLPLFLLCLCP